MVVPAHVSTDRGTTTWRRIRRTKERTMARTTGERTRVDGRAGLMLGLATLGFALCFWAWALLSPLAVSFTAALQLTPFQQSLLVAVPVVVGSLGRIPVGALTDRFGGRVMFPIISLVTVVPVLYLGLFGHSSLAALLVGGFFLGIAGTAFAVGVPFVITAAVLTVYGVVAAVVLRDAPGRTVPTESLGRRMGAALVLPITWQAAALYAIAFGGYVAFSVYLPTYLKNAYLLTPADASNRMAGFVVVAVLMRPVGGWLSDRVRPGSVLTVAFAVVAVGALVQSTTPALTPLGTIVFLSMAGALGAASGATFALVAQRAPSAKVGSVTGIVGAAGGLGGFIPPLVMGSIFGHSGDYGTGLLALSAMAVLVLLLALSIRRTPTPHAA